MSAVTATRYFDNAATSFPKPPAVAEAMARHLTGSGAPARGAYAGARESARLISKCRERIARLVNLTGPRGDVASDYVVFGHNTTDGLNLGVKGVLAAARRRVGPSRTLHVVTTVMEHNSILRPLHAAMQHDPRVEWTKVEADPATGLVDPRDVRAAIRPGETVLVCVNHASNVMGTIQDLNAIGRVCAEFGAGKDDPGGVMFLVDAAQSLGHCAVDMAAAHVDLLAFPGHKGLLGPTGTGGLCIRPGVEKGLDTIREGGTGSASEQQTHPTGLPEKYEPGSHNTVGLIGLSEGVGWLLERGVERIRDHEVELMRRMFAELRPDEQGQCRGAPGLRLLGPLDVESRVGVFSFVHEELSSQEMAAILEASFGILTRAGLHCAPLVHEMLGTSPVNSAGSGAVRLSFGPFLTVQDVDYACAALATICREHVGVARPG
jgi:cysteine desulfurase family protein